MSGRPGRQRTSRGPLSHGLVCLGLSFVLGLWRAPSAAAATPGSITAAAPASAASVKGGDTVVEVRIDGLRRVDVEAIRSALTLQAGQPFDAAEATADLRRIWATAFFRDVRAERQSVAGGWRLIYTVTEKPYVRRVELRGLRALSEDDVRAVLTIKPYTVLNLELLSRNAQKIKELYVGRGYYLAEAISTVTAADTADPQVDIVFDVRESAKVVVRQITFLGNRHVESPTLRAAMQTRVGHELAFLTQAGTYNEENFATDLMRLQALYYDRGFVTVKVGPPVAHISRDRRWIYLTIPIEEGEMFAVGDVAFSGALQLPQDGAAPAIDAAILEQHLNIKRGQTFIRTQLFEDVQRITDLYRDRGYAYANVTPNSRIDPESRQVHLDFEVDPGDIVTIERIEVRGNMRTRDKVVRRELQIVEGERFSAADLNLSRARVYQLGFFENVEMQTRRGSRADLMHVTVDVKEKSTGTFQVGAGFSSIEKLIATAQISQNNFLGNGQLLSLSMQLSFGAYARHFVTLQFVEPYLFDTPFSFGFNGYLAQRLLRDFQRDAKGISPTLGYPLSHEVRLTTGYTLEWVTIRAQEQGVGEPVLFDLERQGRVSAINAAVSYDSRDNRLMPSRGMFHEARFEWSSAALGADASMAYNRTDLTMRAYRPLHFGLVLRSNLQFGLINGGGALGVPISERYFPGGILSVRGFAPRGLGPTRQTIADGGDPSAGTRPFVYGGNKQVIANLEVEFPLVPRAQVRGLIFADAGNAYNDDEGFFYIGTPGVQRAPGYLIDSGRQVELPLGLFYSCGFGVRWLSPIGPLRFEWGIPITKHAASDNPLVFEFTIGNFF